MELSREEINRDQYPDWAEFERTSEALTTVKAKAGFAVDQAHTHLNSALLAVIDQELAKIDAPEFLGVFESSQEITATDDLDLGYTRAHITTANAITITLPAGMKVGTILSFVRTVSSDKAVTLARSGSETIEGGTTWISHLASTTAHTNTSAICIKKISATAWIWVSGVQTGNNSNGSWIKFSDGTMWCRGTKSVTTNTVANINIGTYGWSLYYDPVSPTITFPAAFAGDNPVVALSGVHGACVYANLGLTSVRIDHYAVTNATTTVLFTAFGRWRA